MSGRRTVCLGVMLMVLMARTACADEMTQGACDMPNLRMPGVYRVALQPLVARSATLRRQCGRIAASPLVRVTVEPNRGALQGSRARSRVIRRQTGALDVVIEVPLGRDLAELMAHELEHVLEQIDGLDLARLASNGEEGVQRVADGAFETVRAERAGRLAAIETITRRPIFERRAIPPAPRVMAD